MSMFATDGLRKRKFVLHGGIAQAAADICKVKVSGVSVPIDVVIRPNTAMSDAAITSILQHLA